MIAPTSIVPNSIVGVLGGGTMGCGIAVVAALAKHPVVIYEKNLQVRGVLRDRIRKNLEILLKKSVVNETDARAALAGVNAIPSVSDLSECDLIIESVVEDTEAKRTLLAEVEPCIAPDCVIGTNTSSLSVTALASALSLPQRMVGIHFFNPAPQMPLVEIIRGVLSDEAVVSAAQQLVERWGKLTVMVADTPGFLVNRVARPYYGEALRILEEDIADISTIDHAMRELGGFKMGPFELMDFIGNDVNYATTESIFKAFFFDPRYKPSLQQKRLIQSGRLGRKTGAGFYNYGEKSERPAPKTDKNLLQGIFSRVLVMLISEAALALYHKVGSATDIDQAMIKGMHFPKGLLRWADEFGPAQIQAQLNTLYEEYREDRYRPNPLISRAAKQGSRISA